MKVMHACMPLGVVIVVEGVFSFSFFYDVHVLYALAS